ncbi:hypothetical protein [Bacillus sp. T3]|uniref:hypothetical protein n=1 Tax=Bacillus sp. T3 TaxID=467262 RepID=UPI002981D00C|nr:hypothetical protein [Bacillus sp. T3]
MALILPHIEDANTTNYIPPKGDYIQFLDEAHYTEKVREWGLSGSKEAKKEFWYKERTLQRIVSIKGYESYGITGEYNTLVIQFKDGNLSCIHPALLKEMQSASFGKEMITQQSVTTLDEIAVEDAPQTDPADTSPTPAQINTDQPKPKKSAKEKKEKAPKLVLPAEKVHFTAQVKQFALSWNHFNEENDEVIVLENVVIEAEEPLEVGLAWCAHSKTLKKFELSVGEKLEFDGKIVKKSLPKGKDVEDEALLLETSVSYKVNNPSKIKKI